MSKWKGSHTLKKGTFISGVQCAKRMWWEIHDKGCEELQIDLATQILFDQGNEVGALARERFPGGLLIRRDQGNYPSSFAKSEAAVRNPHVSVIFEAGFVSHDTLVFADILVRDGSSFTLIEVKSKTSVTDDLITDVALQTFILRGAGVPVTRCEVMHLNRACTYPNLDDLFIREDVTELVSDRLALVESELDYLIGVAKGPEPEVAVGGHCSKPRPCAFMDRCWPDVEDDHIRHLYRVGLEKAVKYERDGLTRIQDLPEDLKLSAIAARQRRCLREGDLLVERDELVEALRTIAHPVAHIDFETVMFAIPRWDGCHPYDQIPVQLSAHVVDDLGNERHHSWLATDSRDPRPGIGEAVVRACQGARTVTAYHADFEKKCIKLVAQACPHIEQRLLEIANGIVDLLPMVRDHIYHRQFRGSFSLKNVLPALVPELTYDDLEIGEGMTASAHLHRMLYGSVAMKPDDRDKLVANLMAYCQRDTEAMIALTRRLRELAS